MKKIKYRLHWKLVPVLYAGKRQRRIILVGSGKEELLLWCVCVCGRTWCSGTVGKCEIDGYTNMNSSKVSELD